MSRKHPLDPLILSVLDHPQVRKIFPNLADPEVIDAVALRLAANTGQSFYKVYKIDSASNGLNVSGQTVTLSQDWGVKLSKTQHSFIDTPVSIRVRGDSVLVANNPDAGSVPCSILDHNLNYVGPVGKRGSVLADGEYPSVSDITIDRSSTGNKYYVASPAHIIQSYHATTLEFTGSIGTGVAGASGALVSTPVALGIGNQDNLLYVLCQTGVPAGATGAGYLARVNQDLSIKDRPLFCGKNNGSGLCIQGEIISPKDMVLVPNGSLDDIYILNSTDEIGVFDSNDFKLKNVYNIPSSFSTSNLGLSRIAVKDRILYVTATNIGKVLAINLDTKEMVGTFGMLQSEALTGSDQTLGFFNGLSAVAPLVNRLVVGETLNNRIQTFGTTLFTEPTFNVTYMMERLPSTKKLTAIAKSLVGDVPAEFVLVHPETNGELSIKTAQAIGLDYFKVRMKFSPHVFSTKRSSMDFYPIYILMES